ncbi:ATP-dependent DNA helicase DDX31-like [Glandiceps talaboti]
MAEDDSGLILNISTEYDDRWPRKIRQKKDGRASFKEKKQQKKIEKRRAKFEMKVQGKTVHEHGGDISQSQTRIDDSNNDIGKESKSRRKYLGSSTEKHVGSKGAVSSSLFGSNPEIPEVKRSKVIQRKEPVFSSESFSDLHIHPHMVSNLENNLSISKMTSVQKLCIPNLLEGKDALVRSQTGTGKTLAYAIPMVESLQATQPKIERSHGPYAVILLPTRELALQSYEVILKLMKPFQWVVPGCIMGGEKRKSEKARIRKGINILIATPGRLVDHLQHTENLKLSKVKWLILDEADRLLDMGFEKDITTILNTLNECEEKRQTVLLSATLSEGVKNLAGISLDDPVNINITHEQQTVESTKVKGHKEKMSKVKLLDTEGTLSNEDFCTPEQLKQHFLIVPSKLRLVTLAAFILRHCKYGGHSKMLVFLSSRDSVEFHYNLFLDILNPEDEGDDEVEFFQLHGNMSQEERRRVYLHFVQSATGVLLCTDVAARGLDLPQVKWIVQYNTPGTPADYIHRVGRTARIGKEGQALLFLTPAEVDYIKVLNSHNISLNEMDMQAILGTLLLHSDNDETQFKRERKSHGMSQRQKPNTVEESATALQAEFENFASGDKKHIQQARKAYLSFIRAYATYPSAFKHIFHVKNLHLGHVAKSFALKESPATIGHTSVRAHQTIQAQREKRKRQNPTQGSKLGIKRAKPAAMSEFSSGFDSGQMVANKWQNVKQRKVKSKVKRKFVKKK